MEIERKFLVTVPPEGYEARPFRMIEQAYLHLLKKADGQVLTKKRYLLPVEGRPDLTFELDVFEGAYQGLILAEVEFASEEDAVAFTPPEWCSRDVTWSGEYQNSRLAMEKG